MEILYLHQKLENKLELNWV